MRLKRLAALAPLAAVAAAALPARAEVLTAPKLVCTLERYVECGWVHDACEVKETTSANAAALVVDFARKKAFLRYRGNKHWSFGIVLDDRAEAEARRFVIASHTGAPHNALYLRAGRNGAMHGSGGMGRVAVSGTCHAEP
ncbi:MAG: hypothetical protein KIT16_14495 [Rhodospirillaceae bacterium]|nr:hypothetical protein [Rhodospirillaceae bacterium]